MSTQVSQKIDYDSIIDKNIVAVLKALKSRRFQVFYAPDRESAKQQILDLIPQDAKVGTGDSTAARQIGILEALEERGTTVFDWFKRENSVELIHKLIVESSSPQCNIFLTGTNAVTLDGRLVNVDSFGNRVAGMFYGHEQSVLVIGKNKLVKDLDEAFRRIRTQISPQHVKIRSTDLKGRPFKTGCVKTGKCVDCRGEDRTCNVVTIIEMAPKRIRINVIIVDDDLGLGWDGSWPKKRISKIIKDYKKHVWIPPDRGA